MAVMVVVSTLVVGRSGTASLRTVAFCIPMVTARATMIGYRNPPGTGCALRAASSTQTARRAAWPDTARREQVAPVLPQPDPHLSPGERTEPEGDQRNEGGADGEAGCAGQGESQEHDVAGHVGHEDVPEHQVAEGIDQPGHRRVNPSSNGGRGPCRVARSGARRSPGCR